MIVLTEKEVHLQKKNMSTKKYIYIYCIYVNTHLIFGTDLVRTFIDFLYKKKKNVYVLIVWEQFKIKTYLLVL